MLANVVGCKCRTTELLPILDLHAASTADLTPSLWRNPNRLARAQPHQELYIYFW